MVRKIFRKERLQQILEQIEREGKVYVEELAEKFRVSTSSIRLDLAELDSMGLITRTYGGAVHPDNALERIVSPTAEIDTRPTIEFRSTKNIAEKEAIGKCAAEFVENGDTILVDGGTTTQFFIRNLTSKRDLTIISNSILHINELLKYKNSEIYILGGMIYPDNLVMAGEVTIDSLNQFHVMKSFLGIDGISIEGGLTTTNPYASVMTSIKKKMMESADVHYILADYSKLGKTCLLPVCPISEMHYLITDDKAPTEYVKQLKSMGINVIIAKSITP